MKLTTLPQTTTAPVRSPPVGGLGGSAFDSGCNLSGATRVSIELGSFHWKHKSYMSTIKRVFIDFNKNNSDKDATCFGHSVDNPGGRNRVFSFEVDPNDPIIKAVVWANDTLANAVQFHTSSGHISPMYGTPHHEAKATTFGGREGSHLVGIYGRFGGVIDSLGFTFAHLKGGVPDTIEASWAYGTEEGSTLASIDIK